MRASLFNSSIINFYNIKFLALVLFIFCLNCQNSKKYDGFPQYILWAWERPENLEFIDTNKFGVAFLAQTLEITEDRVILTLRRQPLKVSPSTKLIAVTRIESIKRSGKQPELSDAQRKEILRYILKTLESKNVSAIQIDFDTTISERDFYRQLLADVRQDLPKEIPLSITALASFCIGDSWIRDLSVDEVVPMIFRMGADEKIVKDYLADGNDFRPLICQTSYGIAVDEPIKTNLPDSRRIYFFNVRSWTQKDVELLKLSKNN